MFRGGKVPEDLLIQCENCGMWIFKSDAIIDEENKKLCIMCSLWEDEEDDQNIIEEQEEW